MAMHNLPPLPQLTDAQYAAVVDLFTRRAQQRGLAGPTEAYIDFSVSNLVNAIRNDAIQRQYSDAIAEVDEMLSSLLGEQG